MKRYTTWWAIALLLLALALIPAAALATDLDGYIASPGPTGQWPDEHVLYKGGPYTVSDITGVWQAILWADNFLAQCGGAGVDGVFGTATKNATISWQDANDITADGIVGSQTWGTADNYNVHVPGTCCSAIYDGFYNEVEFYAPGLQWQWLWDWVGPGWETSGHLGYVSFETC